MAQFVHTVRFVIGMAMFACGAVLVQPLASSLLQACRPTADAGPVAMPVFAAGAFVQPGPTVQPGPAAPPAGHGALPAMSLPPMGPGGHAIPDMTPAPAAAAPAVTAAAAPPPATPTPLPESALDWVPPAPGLDGTYRSTVKIPPPPLLDAHAPPPLAAGLTPHEAARPVTPAAPPRDVVAPATYVVRDGDDLTGIALRVYGHAGAASAIWAANRERLIDPQVLPIGLVLRLPPTWTLPATRGLAAAGSGGAIEPATTAAGGWPRTGAGAATPAGTAPGADTGAVWLHGMPDGEPRPTAAAPIHAAAARPRPAVVRIGLGDSFESLAVRYYGDTQAATRIWQANRDRVRSPELLVPGMELRLP